MLTHIIPVVFQKAWRDKRAGHPAKVWLLDKDTLVGSLVPCGEALAEPDYYTAMDSHGRLSNSTETAFWPAEGSFGAIREKLGRRQPLDELERRRLWQFAMGMFSRTSGWRRAFAELLMEVRSRPDLILPKVAERLPPNLRPLAQGPLGLKLMEAILAQHSAELDALVAVLTPTIHTTMVQVGINTIEDFSLPFCIVHSAGRFLASDVPCFVEERSLLPVPTGTAPPELWYMPLSPEMAFVGGKGVVQDHIEVNGHWTATFNSRVRANASRWLVSSTDNVSESDFLDIPHAPNSMRRKLHDAARRALQ